MWQYSQQNSGNNITKYIIKQNNKIITYTEYIGLLHTSKEFRTFFIELLRLSSYDAYFWEVRPVTTDTTNQEFEFVLVNSPQLSKITADNSSFIKYFSQDKSVTSFLNLNGDARLIVPVSMNISNDYSHIAHFVRNAPIEQVQAFWQKVGEEIQKSISINNKWVSTSGLGVHWLHVRIDSNPKYYSYSPYKNFN